MKFQNAFTNGPAAYHPGSIFFNETPKKQNDFVAKTQTEILPYVCFLRINAENSFQQILS